MMSNRLHKNIKPKNSVFDAMMGKYTLQIREPVRTEVNEFSTDEDLKGKTLEFFLSLLKDKSQLQIEDVAEPHLGPAFQLENEFDDNRSRRIDEEMMI